MLSKKECNRMIKNFKNDIDQGKKFLELSLISGADLLIMIHDLEHIVYIPEQIINKEKKVEENKDNFFYKISLDAIKISLEKYKPVLIYA
jgi:hypothetical protein